MQSATQRVAADNGLRLSRSLRNDLNCRSLQNCQQAGDSTPNEESARSQDGNSVYAVACPEREQQHANGRSFDCVRAALLAEAATDSLVDDSTGFTINPRTYRPIGRVDAWAVALYGVEEEFRECPTFDQCKRYLLRHHNLLNGQEDIHFGGWKKHRHCWYLDLAIVITNRSDAEAMGVANTQKAIIHLKTLELVYITLLAIKKENNIRDRGSSRGPWKACRKAMWAAG